MSSTNHANRCKKVYEAEKILQDEGGFVFRRTSPHGLFHVISMKDGVTTFVHVVRLHRFTEHNFNNEMIKVMDFAQSTVSPNNSIMELWIWINHRGWMKYKVSRQGTYELYEDFGYHHYRMTKHIEPRSDGNLKKHRGY